MAVKKPRKKKSDPKAEARRDAYIDLLSRPCKIAVEIGTRNGHWSWRFLSHVEEAWLFCIDPWVPIPITQFDSGQNVGSSPDSFPRWLKNMRPWLGKRVWPIRAKSSEVAEHFPFTIDLLMIDGDHRWKSVKADLTHWVPKVRIGGLVIGHDWTGTWGTEVQKGVNAWLETHEFMRNRVGHGHLVPSNAECFWFRKI